MSLITATLLALLRGLQDLRSAAWIDAMQVIVASCGAIAGVTVFAGGVPGVLLGQLVGMATALAVVVGKLRPFGLSLDPRADSSALRSVLKYGLKADVGNMVHVVSFRFDNLLVNATAGNAALGAYAVATRAAEFLFVLPYAVSLVVLPRVARQRTHSDLGVTPWLSMRVLVASTVVAAAMAFTGQRLFTLVYGGRYGSVYPPFLLLLAGVVLFGWANILMNDVAGRGRPEPSQSTR